MTRADRLNARFNTIKQSVAKVHGEDAAFAAASAAWLRAIQYAQKEALQRIRTFTSLDKVAWQAAGEDCEALEREFETLLKSFHKEICSQLQVDTAQALKLSKHFEQVVRDICFQGG